MNFITTNIRIPEDVYMEIKEEAYNKKKSIGAIMRERISRKAKSQNINTEKFMKRLEKIAKENSKYFSGKNSVQIIREMRDEQ